MQDAPCPGPPDAQIPPEQSVLHRVLPCTSSGSAALRSQETTGRFWGEISVFLLLQRKTAKRENRLQKDFFPPGSH